MPFHGLAVKKSGRYNNLLIKSSTQDAKIGVYTPVSIETTDTYKAFTKQLSVLKKQHADLATLAGTHEGTVRDAYASLAANVLTTISTVRALFSQYKLEYGGEL